MKKIMFFVSLLFCLMFTLQPVLAETTPNIEITLTTGTTNLDLTNFAEDIKSVVYESYGIPKENVIVTKAGASIVNSKDNFNWTIYDHYYSPSYTQNGDTPADWSVNHSIYQPYFYYKELYPYLNDNNAYFEDVSEDDGSTLESCYNRSQHIYPKEKDIYFVGYSEPAYKDFMIYPDTNTGEKTIKFQIQEGLIDTHTLEGAGFLFNTSIVDNKINGYLVLYDYQDYDKEDKIPPSIKLYKLTNVDANAFHNEYSQTISEMSGVNYASTLKVLEGSEINPARKMAVNSLVSGVELIASEYSKNVEETRNIQIKVTKDSFKFTEDGVVIYDTSKENSELNIEDTGAGGFGPLVSYDSHWCESLSYFVFKNLTMETYKPLTFTDIIKNTVWQENTKRFIINVDDDGVPEFANNESLNEIINSMRSNSVYYIGWGLNNQIEGVTPAVYNKEQTELFISKIGKGIFINQEDPAYDTYEKGIVALAQFIKNSTIEPAEPSYTGGGHSHSTIQETITFTDMDNHWAKSEVSRLASLKIINGYPDGSFAPDKAVTRAEFTAFLDRLFKFAGVKTTEGNVSFSDVSEKDWYYESIRNLAPEGIVIGYPDGSFAPNKLITREEAAIAISRAVDKINLATENKSVIFNDEDQISYWAAPFVDKISSLEIIKGTPDGKFNPKDNSTRAEAAMMLYRMLEKANLL